MNAYQQNVDGCESLAMDYPKSDNNGSLSDASTIPKDGDHLKEGSEVAAERNQNENPKLDRALTVLKEYCAIGRESKISGRWTPGVRAYARGANDCTDVGERRI